MTPEMLVEKIRAIVDGPPPMYGKLSAIRSLLAAPIAPAAEDELIEALVEALKPLVGSSRFYDGDEEELYWCRLCDQEAKLGSPIKHKDNCDLGIAIAALARAERKEGEAKHG